MVGGGNVGVGSGGGVVGTATGASGGALGVDRHVLDIFSEEIVRGTAAAPLSQMLRALDPVLREMAHMGAWNVISPVEASGVVEVVDEKSGNNMM